MKKLLAAILAATLLLSSVGCNVTTKNDATGTVAPAATTAPVATAAPSGATAAATQAPVAQATPAPNGIAITVLGMASTENDLNLVRDQLTKAGFVVTLNMQPDYASYLAQMEAGNYDITVSGWTTVTGNPDYAVRSLFKTDADYNRTHIADAEVDRLIELAASQTSAEYVDTYKQLEDVLVTQNGYLIPLYQNLKTQGVNKDILKLDSVRISKARSMVWETIDYVDETKRDTQPMLLSQTMSNLTSLDPIKGNDGSINMINTNQYIRIVNLTDDDQVVSEGSLSYQHAIGDGNSDYYFVLRDDVNFAKVEDKHAVDSGVRVGAEDVVFSLDRAKNKESVPDHRTYSLHSSMEEITIVTDTAVLDSVKESGTGKTLREVLEANTPSKITALTDDKTKVDNAAGTYQIVKVTTRIPFPQVLNYLAHQSAGIVCAEQITAINTYEVASYDVAKDKAYGDQAAITEGASYDNTLMVSGPYIAIYKNDYEIVFEKNPAYMPTTSNAPKIKTFQMKFIADSDAALSALRSGETFVLYSIPNGKFDLVTGDAKLALQQLPSNAVSYLICNLSSATADVNLRLALLYSINQTEIIAFYENRYFPAYSTLAPLVQTGNTLVADPVKVNDYLSKYWDAK